MMCRSKKGTIEFVWRDRSEDQLLNQKKIGGKAGLRVRGDGAALNKVGGRRWGDEWWAGDALSHYITTYRWAQESQLLPGKDTEKRLGKANLSRQGRTGNVTVADGCHWLGWAAVGVTHTTHLA